MLVFERKQTLQRALKQLKCLDVTKKPVATNWVNLYVKLRRSERHFLGLAC